MFTNQSQVERFRNAFPVPTPHFSTSDFKYKGFFIPKGTVIVMNAWTMHHDPERYQDPYAFNVCLFCVPN